MTEIRHFSRIPGNPARENPQPGKRDSTAESSAAQPQPKQYLTTETRRVRSPNFLLLNFAFLLFFLLRVLRASAVSCPISTAVQLSHSETFPSIITSRISLQS